MMNKKLNKKIIKKVSRGMAVLALAGAVLAGSELLWLDIRRKLCADGDDRCVWRCVLSADDPADSHERVYSYVYGIHDVPVL